MISRPQLWLLVLAALGPPGRIQPKVYPYRWVYVSRSLQSDQHVEDIRRIGTIAARHGLNGVVLGAGLDRLDLQPRLLRAAAPGARDLPRVGSGREVRHEGDASLRFENFAANPNGHGRLMQEIAVQPHRCYRVSFWLKTEELAPAGNAPERPRRGHGPGVRGRARLRPRR